MLSVSCVIDINARRLHDINGRPGVIMNNIKAGPR